MREEYELEVLENYDIEVRSTRKIRGAFFCNTDEGTMLLKETKISGQRALLLYMVLSRIEAKENIKVDTPVFTKDRELLVSSREGRQYMLKKWYQGCECDVRQEREVIRGSERLAALHRELEQPAVDPAWTGQQGRGRLLNGRDPLEEMLRHNRELKKVRSFIRSRVSKNEFEYLFLDSFEKMYQLAENVLQRMQDSGCSALYHDSIARESLAHGDYNYHNLLVTGEDMAVTNFDHMHSGIQVHDLYYFIRKIMEKYTWKQKTGQKVVEAYESIRPLSPREKEYIGLCLAYPEKYWKTASTYYHSNKAWISQKSIEKLELAVRQNDEKKAFLENIFSIRI